MDDQTTAQAADHLLQALQAVRDALDIPAPATNGDHETYARILEERAGHALTMLQHVIDQDAVIVDIPWSVGYLHGKLAEHPAAGYKTCEQLTAEVQAAQEAREEREARTRP